MIVKKLLSPLSFIVLVFFLNRAADAADLGAVGSDVPNGSSSINLLEAQPRPQWAASDAVRQYTTSVDMLNALNTYYDAERDALPYTTLTAATVTGLGGVLETGKSRFSRGLGLPFLVIGGGATIGALGWWFLVDARHAMYVDLLNSRLRFQARAVCCLDGGMRWRCQEAKKSRHKLVARL